MDRQAIIASLTPGVLFLIAAIVARLLDLGLEEVIFQFGALLAVLAGGGYAWNHVYSKESVDEIRHDTGQISQAEGARLQREHTEALEQQHADMWQEDELLSGETPHDWQTPGS